MTTAKSRKLVVAFTGTREGMSQRQKAKLEELLRALRPTAFHHGDCVGADAEAHRVARSLGINVHMHPGDVPSELRAFCKGYTLRYAPQKPLDRNKVMVDLADIVIAAPISSEEEQRSGTWATIRYARKQGKLLKLLKRI